LGGYCRLTIEDQTQDVESQPESQTPFDAGGAASDVVASGSIGIALTSTVESGERDGCMTETRRRSALVVE
jgi:hypothetical protein